jgi:MoxR-like ATPase
LVDYYRTKQGINMGERGIDELGLQAQQYANDIRLLEKEIEKVIIGQNEVVSSLINAIIAGGHVLLEGVPGIAKTLLIRTLAQCIGSSFVRLQFTPDLLPADITGTKIYNQSSATFSTVKGPIFHNIVLADEINRAPPKVQSALLEAMQERQVTIQGETYPLESPFFVLATQNPLESEGTYPLPDAQVDRFMLKVLMTYPTIDHEVRIIERFTGSEETVPDVVLTQDQILSIQTFARSIYADGSIKRYVAEIVNATRDPRSYSLNIEDYIAHGASPRASINLILCAKAHALLTGRGYVVPQDIKTVAHDVLRHRILLTYEAEAEGIDSDQIISRVLEQVTVP